MRQKRLHLVVRLTYDPEAMHSGETAPEAKRFFLERVLGGPLRLVSPELGEIGEVEVVEVNDEEDVSVLRPATHIPAGTTTYTWSPDSSTQSPDSSTSLPNNGTS